jgi:Flp pilus assembly protein TadG
VRLGAGALLTTFLHRLSRERGGNVAIMFSLVAAVLLILIGFAVDFGQATRVRAQLQNATDTAALAVARDGLSVADDKLNAIATKYLAANYTDTKAAKIVKLTFDRPTVTAELFTSASVSTTFLRLLGVTTIPVKAHAQTKGLGVEIALVLDTSGSMDENAGAGGKKITALKDATKSLFDILYGTTSVSQRFTVGIVPFAASVNVGAGYKNAAWMDTANSPGNPEQYSDWPTKTTVNRFSFYKGGSRGLTNVDWKGCVMTRLTPYDINDATPSGGATLFAPWFAPDEPDGDNTGWSNGQYFNLAHGPYDNNYLDDEGGVCATVDLNRYVNDLTKLGRTCKYKNVTLSSSTISAGLGPNHLCDSQAITPLTNVRGTLDTAVAGLAANGTTNIVEGFMWGWRVLSPTEPFTQGKAYNAANNRKVIILMTDGVNNYGGASGDFYSTFFANGYAYHGNSGAPKTSNNTNLTTFLDGKTGAACTAAKAKGIIVYTIAFGSGAAASQNLLKGCATDPSYFFAPQNSSDLKPTFQKIAESINALRIAE